MRSLWTFLLNYWLHCDIVFFDGFKGVEAIGGVHPNGIAMDKDERLVRMSIKCGTQRPIGNSERKKNRDCAIVVLCPVEWTIFFLNCKWFNNDACLLHFVAFAFFYIRWPLSLENCFHLFPAIVARGNDRPRTRAQIPYYDLSLYPDFCSASEWLRQISLAAQKTINQKHFPEQGSDTSSVWDFCTRSSHDISRENQWRRLETSAVFSGYCNR